MTRTVFANNRNFSHKGSGDKSLSSTPDICKTPVGSATPPLPYPVVSNAQDADGYTTNVFIDGNPTAIASSTHTKCSGDEPGTGKGLISGKTGDITEFTSYSYDVKCEGEGTIRHQDLTMMNSSNTMGAVMGAIAPQESTEDSAEEGESVFIDFYITDYEEECRIDETIAGEKIWLNIRTRNMAGELVTINLDHQDVAFKYKGKFLIDDTLEDYKLNSDHEKIELDVIESIFKSLYITDLDGNLIGNAEPGDEIFLCIETEGMIGEMLTIDLDNKTADFKHQGKKLEEDMLKDYKINNNLEKIRLEVIEEEG